MSVHPRHLRNLYAARRYHAPINGAIRAAREDLLPAQYRAVRASILEALTAEAAADQPQAAAVVVDLADRRKRRARLQRGRVA